MSIIDLPEGSNLPSFSLTWYHKFMLAQTNAII